MKTGPFSEQHQKRIRDALEAVKTKRLNQYLVNVFKYAFTDYWNHFSKGNLALLDEWTFLSFRSYSLGGNLTDERLTDLDSMCEVTVDAYPYSHFAFLGLDAGIEYNESILNQVGGLQRLLLVAPTFQDILEELKSVKRVEADIFYERLDENNFSFSWQIVWIMTENPAFQEAVLRRWLESPYNAWLILCRRYNWDLGDYRLYLHLLSVRGQYRLSKEEGDDQYDLSLYKRLIKDKRRIREPDVGKPNDVWKTFLESKEPSAIEIGKSMKARQEGMDPFDYITLLLTDFQKTLREWFKRLIEADDILRVEWAFTVSGPTLTDYYIGDEPTDLNIKTAHPFFSLTDAFIINRSNTFKFPYTAPFQRNHEQIAADILEKLSKIPVLTGETDVAMFGSKKLFDNFCEWSQTRINELDANAKIRAVWPIITDPQFLQRINEWISTAQTIVVETTQLRDAIKTLVDTHQFDRETIKTLIKGEANRTGEREFPRTIVLDFWVNHQKLFSNKKRTKGYLRKILAERLTAVVDYLEKNPDPEISVITKRRGPKERGRPVTYFCLSSAF